MESPPSSRLSRNNFDLVRLVLAMIVCLVHSAVLSGAGPLQWLRYALSSEMAVHAFFVVSGFLVFMSYDRSASVSRYFEKRARRLYPAYLTIVLLCAFGFVVISSDPGQYFGREWLEYLAANLVFLNFLHPTLPGVFAGNPVHEVNGALWSLKIEVMFYFAVPVLAAFFRFGRARVLAAVYVLSVLWVVAMSHLAGGGNYLYVELGRQLPGALRFFVVGAAAYYYLPMFERHFKALVAVAMAILVGRHFLPLDPLYPVALGVIVCAVALSGYAGNFGKYGDFSYGLYIVHVPVLQTLVWLGAFSVHPWGALALAIALAMTGAALMWHFVEKRWLARSSHYVRANDGGHTVASVVGK